MLVAPRAIISPSLVPKMIPAVEAISTPRATATDKGKGLCSFPQESATTEAQWIVIGTSAVTTTMTEKEEDDVFPEDMGLTLPVVTFL